MSPPSSFLYKRYHEAYSSVHSQYLDLGESCVRLFGSRFARQYPYLDHNTTNTNKRENMALNIVFDPDINTIL